eukprot:TRINITY_DN9942_c0_g3_i1.p1 TRINITY_DN9942_c0_g3~~TRINITY_DN9942_c0_g3_i1.p1  ORF type:complete len:628 (-),score=112.79 TRINITY_DN9942_c0_g3_i1:133-2016(-)
MRTSMNKSDTGEVMDEAEAARQAALRMMDRRRQRQTTNDVSPVSTDPVDCWTSELSDQVHKLQLQIVEKVDAMDGKLDGLAAQVRSLPDDIYCSSNRLFGDTLSLIRNSASQWSSPSIVKYSAKRGPHHVRHRPMPVLNAGSPAAHDSDEPSLPEEERHHRVSFAKTGSDELAAHGGRPRAPKWRHRSDSCMSSHYHRPHCMKDAYSSHGSASMTSSAIAIRSGRSGSTISGDSAGRKAAGGIFNGFSTKVAEAYLSQRRNRNSFAEKVWRLVDMPESGFWPKVYAMAEAAFTCCSIIFTLVLTTQPEWAAGSIAPVLCEITFDSLYTALLLLRFVVCPDSWVFFTDVFNYIDFLACVPLLCLHVYDLVMQTEGWIALCIVPVVRLMKMLRRFEKFRLLVTAFYIAFEALPVLLYTLATVVLIFSSMIFFVEDRDNIPSLPTAVWLTIVTMTTVGYGDVVPKSELGSAIVAVLVVFSALYMAIPLGIVGNAFSEVWADRDRLLMLTRVREYFLQAGFGASAIPNLFHLFDKDHDGVLNFPEFELMILEMQLGLSEERILKLFNSFDADGSGAVDDMEFVKCLFPWEFEKIYGDFNEEYESEAEERLKDLMYEQTAPPAPVDAKEVHA